MAAGAGSLDKVVDGRIGYGQIEEVFMDNNDFDPGHPTHEPQCVSAGVEPFADSRDDEDDRNVRGVMSDEVALHSELGAVAITNRVLDIVAEDWRRRLFPLVCEEVDHRLRLLYREREEAARAAVRSERQSQSGRKVHVKNGPVPDLLLFVSLLDNPIKRWNGTGMRPDLLFGDMTVAEHQFRADRLKKQIDGGIETRQLHLEAIAACEKYGVDTLRDAFKKKSAA